MATFVKDLWESIFIPGPTPTLLVATNVTFAALQLVFASLLFATWSVHFVVLSGLSGGLWWAINWFARELRVHQLQEEEKERRARESEPAAPSGESETEVETASDGARGRKLGGGAAKTPSPSSSSQEVGEKAGEKAGELKHRAAGPAAKSTPWGSKSSVSTEDEWEKVSENENDKDK